MIKKEKNYADNNYSIVQLLEFLYSEYEAEGSKDLLVSYNKLRYLFTDYKKFVRTFLNLERQNFYTIHGYQSESGKRYDLMPLRIKMDEKYAFMDGAHIEMDINPIEIDRFLHPEKIPANNNKTPDKVTKINKLSICKGDDRKGYIIINDDYVSGVIEVDFQNKSWELLFDLANNVEVGYLDEMKQSLDYFNSNYRCRLYTHLGSKAQKILKVSNEIVRPVILLESISEKAFATRKDKILA